MKKEAEAAANKDKKAWISTIEIVDDDMVGQNQSCGGEDGSNENDPLLEMADKPWHFSVVICSGWR
jgi:hypothetical protein